MQPMISQHWQLAVAEPLRSLVGSITGRVGWPESNFLLDTQGRVVYCPIAKVACTSLKLWMLAIAGDTPAQPFNEHVEVQRYWLKRLGHRAAQRALHDPECFKFAFVRNPWSRVVSAYLNKFLSVNCTSQ